MRNTLLFRNSLRSFLVVTSFLLLSINGWGQTPVPMSSQVGLTYTENFADITNWTNNFAAGTGANRWGSYPLTTGGTANDGKRTTKSSATFVATTSGGVQKGTGNLVFLSTGSGTTSEAVAVDFLMDFTGVNAGTLSFNWAAIDNASGTRPTSLRVYWSIDNVTFTELTTAQVLDIQSVNSGSITTIALPANFNNAATARLRFYNHAGAVTGGGNRDKIAIDDVTVTATAAAVPVVSAASPAGTVGTSFTYNISATNSPTSYAISSGTLPAALSLNTTTGAITGTPTTTGSVSVDVTATNGTGTSAAATLSFTISSGNQTIVFGALPAKITTDGDFSPGATSVTSGINPITYASSNTSVATIVGGMIHIVGAGTSNITASQAGNGNYNAASDVMQVLTVTNALLSQTITFNPLTAATYGDSDFGLTATASSGLTVTYVSSNTAVATVSGSTITIVGVGSTNITASQAGDGSYNPAPNVIQSLVVGAKTLTVATPVAQNKVYNGTNAAVITGTLSGIVGADNVTLTGTGTFADVNVATGIAVTSTSVLGGANASNYTLSQPTGLTADITQASQTITFGVLANKNTTDAPFALTGSASSGLAVTYISSNPAVATISGSTVTIVGAGSTTITASQVGNSNYTPAVDVVQGLLVNSVIYINQFTGVSACPTNGNVPAVSPNASGASLSRSTITCTAAGNVLNSTTLNVTSTVNNASYIEFSVTAAAGYKLNVTSLSFFRQGSSSAPNSLEVRYSTDGFATSTSWGAAPNTTTSGTVATWDFADFSSSNGGTVTFRVYPYGTQRADLASPALAGGTFRLDDVTVNGDVSLITDTTWNGTAWSNGAPSATIDAIIAGVYSTTTNGAFTAKKVTVNSGSLIINSGTNVTIQNELINNLTAADVVVENNANLIQVNAIANTGNITVNRNSASLMRQDYTLWASPVSGQQLQAFSPATLATRFYTYDPINNIYSAETSTNNFATGKGYLIRMPNDHPATAAIWNGTFTGTPNNGDVNLTVTNATYNAVGNPYPSAIDANLFISTNGISEALYFWRKTNNSATTSYATYTTAGGVSNSGSDPLNLAPNRYMRVGQGFIAKSTGTTLSFTNAMKVANNTDVFLRTAEDINRIWVNLTNTAGLFSQTMVAYMPTATQGIDAAIDGRFFNDSQTALTSIINTEEFAIQGRALPFDTSDIVPLGFKSELAGNYSIALDHFDGLFTGNQDIFLKDNLMNTTHDLKAGPYNFATAAGVFNSRFEIVYQNSLLNVNLPDFNENSVVVYKNNEAIRINTGSTVMDNVKIFDIRGRLLIEKSKVNATDLAIDSSRFGSQVMIVQITSDTQIKVSKKVVN